MNKIITWNIDKISFMDKEDLKLYNLKQDINKILIGIENDSNNKKIIKYKKFLNRYFFFQYKTKYFNNHNIVLTLMYSLLKEEWVILKSPKLFFTKKSFYSLLSEFNIELDKHLFKNNLSLELNSEDILRLKQSLKEIDELFLYKINN